MARILSDLACGIHWVLCYSAVGFIRQKMIAYTTGKDVGIDYGFMADD